MTEKRESIEEMMQRKKTAFNKKLGEFLKRQEEFENRFSARMSQPSDEPRIGDTPPKTKESLYLDGNKPSVTTKPSREVKEKKPNNISTIKIDVDVSEGIKSLKALQREAKETVKLLKEVEELSKLLNK